MVTLADGRALVSWAAANAAPTLDIEGPLKRLTSGWPDVIAGSSSRGPGATMGIKPDIAAPGSSVLSSVVNDTTGAVDPAGLFDQLSGTSMSTPHITALAALTKSLHPGWTPAQVKSALMNTAETAMSLDLEGNIPALAKHRGGGRVNAARLVNPQLTFDPPSLSFGLVAGGPVEADDDHGHRHAGERSGMRATRVSSRAVVGSPAVGIRRRSRSRRRLRAVRRSTIDLGTAGATAGDYEGFIEITGGGQTYTIPYFVRVQDPAVAKDVLLIDWDRNVGGVDFRPAYRRRSTASALSYDVFDGGTLDRRERQRRPDVRAAAELPRGRVLHRQQPPSWANAHVGGSFPLEDYLVAGGKIVMTGQDLNSSSPGRCNQNSGSDCPRDDGRVADRGGAGPRDVLRRPAATGTSTAPARRIRRRPSSRRRSRCSGGPVT